MKRFIIITIIMFFLSLVIFSIYKNIEIGNDIKSFQNLNKISHSLELLIEKQHLVLHMSESSMNYDEFVIKNKESQKLIKELLHEIENIDVVHLKEIFESIKKKNEQLEYIYEDIKSDRAVLMNSLLMLKKRYKEHVVKSSVLSYDELTNLLDIMSSTHQFNIFQKETKDKIINLHLKIINDKQNSLNLLDESLEENRLSEDLEEMISHVNHEIKDLVESKTKIINLLLASSVFLIGFGFVTYNMGVNRDIEKLKEARDAAIVAENAKDEFFSNMSHELRTPLNSIYGFSNVLLKDVNDENHRKYLNSIVVSSEHLIGLINDILDLSKLQSGKFILDINPFKPDEKIDTLLERFDAHLSGNNLTLKKDMDLSLNTVVIGDWLRISQIITNLLSNAIKFSTSGESVYFSAKYENGNFYFCVKDTGIGMDEETQKKVFNAFEQADSSTTRKYGGTGLGLSIVSSLIEQMDASLELISKQGEGSEFKVTIPLEKSNANIKDDAQKQEVTKELDGHILIVEDNKTNQLLIGILIEELGLSYDMANDGLEGIEMFKNNNYDLILMDENMPNLNGIGAMQEIRKLQAGDLPIIALTANVMTGDEERFLAAGMDGYLSKPIQSDKLYKVLESFLNTKV